MSGAVRKAVLAVHLVASVGWIGAVVAYLALGVAAATSVQDDTVRAAWIAMELTGWYVIVPAALTALTTGVVLALGSRWGLLRHHWVAISFVLTVVATAVLLLHMPSVSSSAAIAREATGTELAALGGDLLHPAVGLVVLLVVHVLNVYKPQGMTTYGRRRARATAAARRDGS